MPAGTPKVPLGDPNRWGAQINTPLTAGFTEIFTPQFLQIKPADNYGRSWSINGTLKLPSATWADMAVTGNFPCAVILEVYQGVGQTIVMHSIILAMGDALGGTNPIGLCNQQDFRNGGPYLPFIRGAGADETETRPFAAVTALVANSLNIRARYIGGSGTGLPAVAELIAVVSPLNPGSGA